MSFKAWLRKQTKRQDPVGDFARDWTWADQDRMPPVRSFKDIKDHLAWRAPEPVMRAALRAWEEFAEEHAP